MCVNHLGLLFSDFLRSPQVHMYFSIALHRLLYTWGLLKTLRFLKENEIQTPTQSGVYFTPEFISASLLFGAAMLSSFLFFKHSKLLFQWLHFFLDLLSCSWSLRGSVLLVIPSQLGCCPARRGPPELPKLEVALSFVLFPSCSICPSICPFIYLLLSNLSLFGIYLFLSSLSVFSL